PDAPSGSHQVIFFESAVVDHQFLEHGLSVETEVVELDSSVDGVRAMADFLAKRHDISSISIVAHGAPGEVSFGTTMLNVSNLGDYARELAVVGSSLAPGGELDLWSCDAAAGPDGASFVQSLAALTGAQVAAASHPVGSAALGGSWQLDVRTAGAQAEV